MSDACVASLAVADWRNTPATRCRSLGASGRHSFLQRTLAPHLVALLRFTCCAGDRCCSWFQRRTQGLYPPGEYSPPDLWGRMKPSAFTWEGTDAANAEATTSFVA
jgi:hypothetical protein